MAALIGGNQGRSGCDYHVVLKESPDLSSGGLDEAIFEKEIGGASNA
ncbi:MAG TPA: hypothetical protein VLE95_05425 [Chlamydiales bacterium]|nr:hypothetical protein [Chlamydiales bacterium]